MYIYLTPNHEESTWMGGYDTYLYNTDERSRVSTLSWLALIVRVQFLLEGRIFYLALYRVSCWYFVRQSGLSARTLAELDVDG